MSELSGTAAVGIETVEWLDGGSGNLIVRVTGRWRRRRPASTAQVTLVIESEGRRHRFPAMPEPPSLGGAGPGMWRLSFSVPGSLAPALGGHIWLALGTVTVSLPAPGAGERDGRLPARGGGEHDARPSGQGDGRLPVTDEGDHVSAETRNEEFPPIEPARPPDEPPTADPLEELERQLVATRSDRERLAASLAEGERTRRIAEQRAHAEQALRRDLARQLATHEREAERAREAMGELAAAEDRIRTLERQLRDARRREDEAEQQAAAAIARARPRPAAAPVPPPTARDLEDEDARLQFERRLRVRLADGRARVPAEPSIPLVAPAPRPAPPPAAQTIAPAPARTIAPAPARTNAAAPAETNAAAPAETIAPPPASVPESALIDTLRRELDARAAGEAALRSRIVAAETRLAARVLLDQRTAETLRQLRAELEGLRGALEGERARREAAESRAAELEAERRARAEAERRAADLERALGGQRERSRDAYDAIGELRGALERLATPPPPDVQPPASDAPPSPAAAEIGSSPGPGPVAPDRLSDALARLRESVPAPDTVPETTSAVSITAGGRTLEAAFRRLVRRDADAAGELLLDLLVLQQAVYPHPIAYDLVLGPGRGCVRVTVGKGAPTIERQGAARTREEVDFRVRGEPARIARLLTAHGIWRRVGPRVARVRGRRDGLAALEALLSLPLDLSALSDAGATLRAEALLGLVAGMVDPAWTAGERFVIALRDPDGRATYLGVRDGRPLQVIRTAPAGRIATTIDGPPDVLVAVLSGVAVPDGHISGDVGPLESLRTWIKHAQSG